MLRQHAVTLVLSGSCADQHKCFIQSPHLHRHVLQLHGIVLHARVEAAGKVAERAVKAVHRAQQHVEGGIRCCVVGRQGGLQRLGPARVWRHLFLQRVRVRVGVSPEGGRMCGEAMALYQHKAGLKCKAHYLQHISRT